VSVEARGVLTAALSSNNAQAFVADSAAVEALETTIAAEVGGGVTADMVNAAPEVVAGGNGQVQVQFTITVPVGSPSISLTPASARQTLASVDINQLITDLQGNLDTATGTPGQYQLDTASISNAVDMTGLTIVVPEGSSTGGTDGGEIESHAHGQVAHAAAQLLAVVTASLLAFM